MLRPKALNGAWVAGVGLMLLSGCQFTDQSRRVGGDLEQGDYGINIAKIDESTLSREPWQVQLQAIAEYSRRINTLSSSQLLTEFQTVEDQFRRRGSVVDRLRYALLLVQPGTTFYNPQQAARLVDEYITDLPVEGGYWRATVRLLGNLLDHYSRIDREMQRLNEAQQRVTEENRRLAELNKTLQQQLESKQAELATVEKQLKELKNIEQSILERDIQEGEAGQ